MLPKFVDILKKLLFQKVLRHKNYRFTGNFTPFKNEKFKITDAEEKSFGEKVKGSHFAKIIHFRKMAT